MLEKVTNHPVHVVYNNDDSFPSPTALIPFCEFGGNMSIMGVKIDELAYPVCSSFRPKRVKDQLCFMVNPNEYKGKVSEMGELSLNLAIDFNEDREFLSTIEEEKDEKFELEDDFEKIDTKLIHSISVGSIGTK